MLTAYQFWYQSSPGAKTEYIWIISDSFQEAVSLFKQHYSWAYDYETFPCDRIPEQEWENEHLPNQILGGNVII